MARKLGAPRLCPLLGRGSWVPI